jgi:hypothetical protein
MGTMAHIHSQMIALRIFYDLPLSPLIKAGNTRCFVVVNQRSRYVLLPCSERLASKNKIRNTRQRCGADHKVTNRNEILCDTNRAELVISSVSLLIRNTKQATVALPVANSQLESLPRIWLSGVFRGFLQYLLWNI